jgi:hypothetical protein
MDRAPMDLYKMGAWENNFVKYKKQPEKTTKKNCAGVRVEKTGHQKSGKG